MSFAEYFFWLWFPKIEDVFDFVVVVLVVFMIHISLSLDSLILYNESYSIFGGK